MPVLQLLRACDNFEGFVAFCIIFIFFILSHFFIMLAVRKYEILLGYNETCFLKMFQRQRFAAMLN